MIAALTVQWIAIGAAALIVVVLLVILLLRRSREAGGRQRPEAPARIESASFLDEPVSGGFERLGKPVTASPWQVAPEPQAPPAPPPLPASPEPELQPAPVPEPEPAPEPPAAATDDDKAVAPLSEIIVTTNRSEVDLTDPDVRALVMQLVHDEIELAETYRRQGQTLDAILQLTEAEKACIALGMTEQADMVRAMMKELQP